jgi:hypothetical protein
MKQELGGQKMRRSRLFSKLLAAGLTFTAFCLPVISRAVITLSSAHYAQGSIAVVSVTGPDRPLKILGLKQRVRFHRSVTRPVAWALLAVPLGTRPGWHRLRCQMESSGKLDTQTLYLRVDGRKRRSSPVVPGAPGFTPDLKVPLDEAMVQALVAEGREQRAVLRSLAASPQWRGPFCLPVVSRISGRFGVFRRYNGGQAAWTHKGVDLASLAGTPVLAANSGTVRLAEPTKAHGGAVILDHGSRLATCYYHLSDVLVKPGQKVAKGQVIGRVGSGGIATGPHLHWQMMLNGFPVNPLQWVPESQLNLLKKAA